MRAGYGRGYYGEGQLLQEPERRRGSGWIKFAFVVGAGAVIWLMWPRKTSPEGTGGDLREDPRVPPWQPPPDGSMGPHSQGQIPQGAGMYGQGSAQFSHGQVAAQLPQGQLVVQSPQSHALMQSPPQGPAPQSLVVQNPVSQQQAYEDAVVASARQLQATGAKVVMAPHLSHLTSRLSP